MIYFIGNKSLFNSFSLSTVEDCISYFNDKPYIAVDTETQGRDCHSKKILSLQLGDNNNQYVIDCRYIDITLFKELLESKLLILHNAKFDYKFLKKVGICPEYIYDTMLAECVIYCGYEKFGYGLQALAKRYCNVFLDKDVRGDFFNITSEDFTDQQIQYAASDVKYLDVIMRLQQEKIIKYNLTNVVNLENNAIKALADIEYNGMYLDRVEWLELAKRNAMELRQVELDLDDIVTSQTNIKSQIAMFEGTRTTKINYSSSSQTIKIAKKLGFILESTDDRFISKLADKHPFFKKLSKYRELSKKISTYGKSFLKAINKTTNRVHTDFWPVLNTGRVSSGNKETGAPNLQNIPAENEYRGCFKAKKGFMWVSADYSQQELMLLAECSDEEDWIETLNNNEDLHCKVGSIMYKRTIDKVKDKDIRTKVKTLNFSKAYGIGPSKFADNMNIPISEARELFELYTLSFPKVAKWLKEQGKLSVNNLKSTTLEPCPRIRWYPQLKEYHNLSKEDAKALVSQVARWGPNQIIQGTGANICKEALIAIRDLIKEYNNKYNSEVAYLVCTVHDAIDCEVREDLAEEFAKKMEQVMVECGNRYVQKVKMKVDITITPQWFK